MFRIPKGPGADRNGIWGAVCGIRCGSEKWDLECCVSTRCAKDTHSIDSQLKSVSHQSRGAGSLNGREEVLGERKITDFACISVSLVVISIWLPSVSLLKRL